MPATAIANSAPDNSSICWRVITARTPRISPAAARLS
jgi:hypothetical protein